MARITDLEDMARRAGAADGDAYSARLAQRLGYIRTPGTRGEIEARIDGGRWLCDCPFCGGAEMVSRKGATFFCLSCGMAENGGQAQRVAFPENREAIEMLLEPLPAPAQRWRRGD
jgi:hypothetical protein